MRAVDLEETYRRYYPVIWAKSARMLRDPVAAQDVAQETFTRLWDSREQLRDEDAVLAWVYRTATRLAVDRIRSRGRSLLLATAPVRVQPDLEQPIQARDQLQKLSQWLRPAELEVLVLCRVDGLTHVEAAGVLQSSERTVRRLLRRADARLERFQGELA